MELKRVMGFLAGIVVGPARDPRVWVVVWIGKHRDRQVPYVRNAFGTIS